MFSNGADGVAALEENDSFVDAGNLNIPSLHAAPDSSAAASNNKLVPTKVLDSILEAATLFSMTFPSENGASSEQLSQFVNTAFGSFLQHVRSELLEQVVQMAPKDWKHELGGKLLDPQSDHLKDEAETGEQAGDEQPDSDEKAYEHIASATTLLLESVRQLASGLALPEVAIDLELASSLVDQAVGLSEAMVRRRVDQKFYTLRFRVIEDCLAPFCRKALQDPALDTPEKQQEEYQGRGRVDHVVQMAGVALSDSLQLVDDTVRSILASVNNDALQGSASSFGSAEDSSMLKTAVEQSTARFAVWLAAAMESLAGCEASEPNNIVDVQPELSSETGHTGEDGSRREFASLNVPDPSSRGTFGDDENDLGRLVENCMMDLLDELDALGTKTAKADLTLAIVEMCRVAQGSVFDDIAASIATHTGSINKQRSTKAGLFATSPGQSSTVASNPTSERFRLAASRALNLYAMDKGNEAGELLCSRLLDLTKDDPIGESAGPRACVWSILTLVKSVCYESANLFGGPKRAGPVPENLEDEYTSLTLSRRQQAVRSSGLAFDVERMFVEKVIVYPHPSEMVDFQRNSVVALLLKVAFKALIENARNVRFSVNGYRQFLVDLEFLKFMIPHYVEDEVLETLLTEAVKCAKERCHNSAMLNEDTEEINQARAAVRDFMAVNDGEEGILNRISIPDEEGD